MSEVVALVLAAGESRRMGRPKMTLPWGDTTVIGQVVRSLGQAGLSDIVVVTGGHSPQVQHALDRLHGPFALRSIYNPQYARLDMLGSLQIGLSNLGGEARAALIALGDQPQIESEVVHQVLRAYHETRAKLVVPSYQMRRGHPWLLDRSLWPQALALRPPASMRDFLAKNAALIVYVTVDTSSIMQDLDTPEDYQCRPGEVNSRRGT